MDHNFAHKTDRLATLLADRLGVHAGQGFEQKLRKAGRRLPRWARKDGAAIVGAMSLETHPKMSMRVDQKPVNRSIRNLTSYLEGIDPNKRRVERLLDILAMIALVLIVTVGGFVTYMVWQGLI
ncbi:hypothetical protein [Pacificibacter sp.]|uniref:hypothetical protein n=1 Tax=Pacificibacter sp. TaxID=1917866 RepID=UPI00321A39B2